MRENSTCSTACLAKRVTSIAACGPLLATALMFAGCTKSEEVRAYTVAKPPAPVRPASVGPVAPTKSGQGPSLQSGRMLGAIVPRGEQTWFFKLTGTTDAVVQQVEPFLRLIQSVKFDGETPAWTLPEGWSERPGNEFRYKTLTIDDADEPLEVSVSALPTAPGDFNEYLLANINRWRGQMKAAQLKPDELEQATKKFTFGDVEAWFVMIQGQVAGTMGAGSPTPAPARRESASGSASGPRNPNAESPPLPFTAELPAGWSRKPAGPMRIAEWEVLDGGQRISISASTAGGDLPANVNRWRGQVKLDALPPDDLQAALREIAVGDLPGQYVELVGPESDKRQTILGVVVQAGGRQWFFKLQGDADLADREKPRFEAFVKSIRFGEGAPDGQ